MQLNIPFQSLHIIAYEGAGNVTPVLDVSMIPGISEYPIETIRKFLETDQQFRVWLKENGTMLRADSVMIYYRKVTPEYEYVTFVGEPNASLTSNFSEMCGNGIRALGLHIACTSGARDIRIWAGSPKTLSIYKLNVLERSGDVEVSMGKFRYHGEELNRYVQIKNIENLHTISLPGLPFIGQVGIGFNGQERGEPHVCLILSKREYQLLAQVLGVSGKDVMSGVRQITSRLGHYVTFNTSLFPDGINFNVGVINRKSIVIATHERSIVASPRICLQQQKKHGICRCCTKACGTGGAAVVNVAQLQGKLPAIPTETIHFGGNILYDVRAEDTIMRGPARQMRFSPKVTSPIFAGIQ